MEPSAEEILAQVAAGDTSALAILFDRYGGRVLALILKYVRSRDDAADLLQDIFFEVWNRAASFDMGRSRVDTWLLLIARSRALDHLRKCRPDAGPLDLQEPASGHDPAREAQRTERSERLRGAVLLLPEDQRQAIELAFFSGLTHEQIASRLGAPLGTVKTRIRLGMSRLRGMLQEFRPS
jgi:RNA polymerase sigma-70 factor (ECF subfamily)